MTMTQVPGTTNVAGDLLAELHEAAAEAMEGGDANFAAARAGWAKVLDRRNVVDRIDHRIAELVAELDAVRLRIAKEIERLQESKREAQRESVGIHEQRAIVAARPARLVAALDAASRRRGKLMASLSELKAAAENARRREASYRAEAQRWHPGEEAHREKSLRIANGSAEQAKEYDDEFRAAEIEIRELAEAIADTDRRILS